MILIIGALGDSGIAHLLHRLLDRRVPFLLLDPRDHGKGFQLSWEMEGERMSGTLRHGREISSLEEVGAVYVHLWRGSASADRVFSSRNSHALLRAFLETAPVPVCNRPSRSASNFSKTFQQQLILAAGFAVPRTLVTNQPEEARAFFAECRGRVVYKSLSGVRSQVTRVTEADLERLELLASGPTQFQEWIPGSDLRVHVMGSRVYATAISTEATDYRFASREGNPPAMRGVVLSEELAERCVDLTSRLGLMSAGVDLRQGLNGRCYCLEVNPTPAFAFYEQFTGQRIADGLIDALLEAAAASGRPVACGGSRAAEIAGGGRQTR